jgi:hypothetical protein
MRPARAGRDNRLPGQVDRREPEEPLRVAEKDEGPAEGRCTIRPDERMLEYCRHSYRENGHDLAYLDRWLFIRPPVREMFALKPVETGSATLRAQPWSRER